MQTDIEIREMDLSQDLPSVERIWKEVGWIDDEEAKALKTFLSDGNALVATMAGQGECCVHVVDGTIRLQHVDLPLSVVTAVTTSRIARGHAFAKRLTARQLQRAAQNGAAVAALGMFDQGFYDQVGFGSGGYDHQFAFDPSTLKVSSRVATPRRLSVDDHEDIYQAMANRQKVHGSVVIHGPAMLKAELEWSENGFGLGYGSPGALTHFVWLSTKSIEHGPYRVEHMAYQSTDQLLELLGLLKSLSDQIYSVKLIEPPELQLQDLLARPFRHEALSARSPYAAEHESFAWWQFRVLDVSACVAAFQNRSAPIRFTLTLTDPVQSVLEAEKTGAWAGLAGQYVVTLGERSEAHAGSEDTLPTLSCSVNAFSRLLFGAAPASSLALSDDLEAPEPLLQQLDEVLRLPTPHTGWDF